MGQDEYTMEAVQDEFGTLQQENAEEEHKEYSHHNASVTSEGQKIRKKCTDKKLAIGIPVAAGTFLAATVGGSILAYKEPWKKAPVSSSTPQQQPVLFQGWTGLLENLYLSEPTKLPPGKPAPSLYKGRTQTKPLIEMICESTYGQIQLANLRGSAIGGIFVEDTEEALFQHYLKQFAQSMDISTEAKRKTAYDDAIKLIGHYHEEAVKKDPAEKKRYDKTARRMIQGMKQYEVFLSEKVVSSQSDADIRGVESFIVNVLLIPFLMWEKKDEMAKIWDKTGKSKYKTGSMGSKFKRIKDKWYYTLDFRGSDSPIESVYTMVFTEAEMGYIREAEVHEFMELLSHAHSERAWDIFYWNKMPESVSAIHGIFDMEANNKELAKCDIDGQTVMTLEGSKLATQNQQGGYDKALETLSNSLDMFFSFGELILTSEVPPMPVEE